jgi:hypothetical protein
MLEKNQGMQTTGHAHEDVHAPVSRPTDNQADSQPTRRFLTRTEYQQSEGKEDCTANQAQHAARDTTNTNYKDGEALLKLSLMDSETKLINLETVMHASGERESLVNTWAEKEISDITYGRCNREVRESHQTGGENGQSGKRQNILNCYGHGLEFIKAKPDESLRQEMMYGDSTSIQNTSFHGLATNKQSTGPSSHTSAHQDFGYLSQQKEWLQLQTRTDQLTRERT